MIFEHIISAIAPFACLGCRAEGPILCTVCQAALPPSTNVGNGATSSDYMAVTSYRDVAKDVVHALKFGRARSAADCIARVMADRVALPPGPWLVTHTPTAHSRVRLRGYDQAQLIAKRFARYQRLPYAPLLGRLGNTRQVGATRRERLEHAGTLFRVRHEPLVQNAKIILIDDVITTGSTMQAASQLLVDAGAQAVHALAFARAE